MTCYPDNYDKNLYYFDKSVADGVVNFIERHIHHIKGEWASNVNSFIKLEDWQKRDIIYPLFGLKERATGLRRYKYCYIELPRKNAKSTLLAALIVVFLLFDKDPGAELYSAASSRDQAKIVFDLVGKMFKSDKELSKIVNIYQNAINFKNKSYKAVSADVNTNHGGNTNFVCFDELHAQPNRHLFDVLQTSMAAKKEPLFIMITTAGYDLNSICYEQHEYALNVKNGIIKDDRYLPVIYAAEKEDDPFEEATWKKANPNYGISVKKEYIKEQAERAKINSAYLNTFLRLHLNIWTSVNTLWIRDEVWKGLGADIDKELLKGEFAYGGLDLSSKSDITAFSLIFPPNEHRNIYADKYITLNWFWLPQDKGRDSADKNNNNYKQWVKEGWIEETNGNVIDYDYILERIMQICSYYNVAVIAYDPYNSTQIASKLEDEGIELFQHRQGFVSMNEPTLHFEVLCQRGDLVHNNNPVMRWMVSNGVLLSDTSGKLFKIGKNMAHQKIDGLITNIMCVSLCMNDLDKSKGSYLDKNEVQWIEL